MTECPHGLESAWCSVCLHGVTPWPKRARKRPFARAATPPDRRGTAVPASGRPHPAGLHDRGYAPARADRRRPPKTQTRGQYGDGPPSRVTRGAKGPVQPWSG